MTALTIENEPIKLLNHYKGTKENEAVKEVVTWFLELAFPARTREEVFWYLYNNTVRPRNNCFFKQEEPEVFTDYRLDLWIYNYFKLYRTKYSLFVDYARLETVKLLSGEEVVHYRFFEGLLKEPLSYKE